MGQALRTAGWASDERRSTARLAVGQDSTLRDRTLLPTAVIVRDMSATGFAVETDHPLVIGDIVSIGLVGIGSATARVVRRTAAGYGCALLRPLSAPELQQAFKADTVVDGGFPSMMSHSSWEEAADCDERWPRRMRVVIVIGGALTCWAGLLGWGLLFG